MSSVPKGTPRDQKAGDPVATGYGRSWRSEICSSIHEGMKGFNNIVNDKLVRALI